MKVVDWPDLLRANGIDPDEIVTVQVRRATVEAAGVTCEALKVEPFPETSSELIEHVVGIAFNGVSAIEREKAIGESRTLQ